MTNEEFSALSAGDQVYSPSILWCDHTRASAAEMLAITHAVIITAADYAAAIGAGYVPPTHADGTRFYRTADDRPPRMSEFGALTQHRGGAWFVTVADAQQAGLNALAEKRALAVRQRDTAQDTIDQIDSAVGDCREKMRQAAESARPVVLARRLTIGGSTT